LFSGGQVFAQNNPLISLDELGNGFLLFPGGQPILTHGTLQPDPGPGGLASVMTYNLLGPPSLVAGDVLVHEGTIDGLVLDVLRFNPAGTGGNPAYPASALIYSDNTDGFDAPADTPSPPLAFYTNQANVVETGTEQMNSFTYTPAAGQPGFVAGFSVTYFVQSDVPEPSSIALFGVMGTLGGVACVWRKRRARAVATPA
jgi:hypothetical protein